MELSVTAESGNTAAIQTVTEGKADAAFTTRTLSAEDRANAPSKSLHEQVVGMQVVTILVSRDIWDSGIRGLSKQQLTDIYESRATNWKALGGEDRPVKYYNYERGRGLWEAFVQWLYGDTRRAALGTNFPMVVSGEDAQTTVEFNFGSLTLATPLWANGKTAMAMPIIDETGKAIDPSPANLLSKAYPLSRSVTLIFGDRPTGANKRLLDYMMSPEGQALIKKNDLVPQTELVAK